MERMTVDPADDHTAGFILSPRALITSKSTTDLPELSPTPERAAELDGALAPLRAKSGEMERGKVDWYFVRLQGTVHLPHALLGLLKGSLSSKEREGLGLNHSAGLDKNDVNLLESHGLLTRDLESKNPIVPEDLKRVIRASIQLKVEDQEKQLVTLVLRSPYKNSSN